MSGLLTLMVEKVLSKLLHQLNHLQMDRGAVALPLHSYWFDFWVFVLLNVALFIFVYFVVP
uniref:Uncharacterized protein n=1 Tax=Oryzias latipes TaxID=8090 RepID=A0A3P9MPH9_ORYLA